MMQPTATSNCTLLSSMHQNHRWAANHQHLSYHDATLCVALKHTVRRQVPHQAFSSLICLRLASLDGFYWFATPRFAVVLRLSYSDTNSWCKRAGPMRRKLKLHEQVSYMWR